jgi:hypothetical protein
MSADFYSLKWTLPTTFPFSRSMDSPGHTVSLKSEKFEMELGLRGRKRTYLTIFKRAWSADSKMVR